MTLRSSPTPDGVVQWTYATYGIPRTGLTLALAHLVITTPYSIRLVSVSLAGFDRNLERAARSLGASGWTTFRLVTLPLIRPGSPAARPEFAGGGGSAAFMPSLVARCRGAARC